MAKPFNNFEFATDTNYATGPDSGTPTKVAPSAGEIDSGFVRGTAAVAQHMNFLMGSIQDWLTYLAGLASDTEFLGEDFAWTGQHTFDQDVNYDAAKPFTRWLPLQAGRSDDTVQVDFSDSGVTGGVWTWDAGTSLGSVFWDLDLPTGAVLTDVHIAFDSTAGHLDQGSVTRVAMNNSTGAQTAAVNIRQASATGASGTHLLALPVAGGEPQSIDRTSNVYRVIAHAENPGAPSNSSVRGVRISYTMPGYRNG